MATITTNGNTRLATSGSRSIIRVFGTFASASLILGYLDSAGSVRAFSTGNPAKTADGEWDVTHGQDEDVYIMTSSATGSTSITAEISKVY